MNLIVGTGLIAEEYIKISHGNSLVNNKKNSTPFHYLLVVAVLFSIARFAFVILLPDLPRYCHPDHFSIVVNRMIYRFFGWMLDWTLDCHHCDVYHCATHRNPVLAIWGCDAWVEPPCAPMHCFWIVSMHTFDHHPCHHHHRRTKSNRTNRTRKAVFDSLTETCSFLYCSGICPWPDHRRHHVLWRCPTQCPSQFVVPILVRPVSFSVA